MGVSTRPTLALLMAASVAWAGLAFLAPGVGPDGGLRAPPRSMAGQEALAAERGPQDGSSGISTSQLLVAVAAFAASATLRVAAASGRRHQRSTASTELQSSVPSIAAVAAAPGQLLFGELPSLRSKLAAAPGAAAEDDAGRGALVVAHDKRHRKGLYGRFRKHDMYLKYSKAKPFAARSYNLYRQAKTRVIRAFKDRYISRRLFKRDRKKLWIMRVNNNCRLHGVSYSYFMRKHHEANIALNRKIMSQLGVYDPGVFTNIMDVAIPFWQKKKARRTNPPKEWTVEGLDAVTIPMIEKSVPELYTDEHVRFNRKVHDWGVEYTVQMGDPEGWREMLPQMPELANFNIPDHWIGNANAEMEGLPLNMMPVPEHLENDGYLEFKRKVEATWKEEEERAERGEPTWPKKEGVSREDWFKEEPQTWY